MIATLKNHISVQAAILSYGAFDIHRSALEGFEGWKNPFGYMGASLPRGVFGVEYNVEERTLPPQLLTAGSEDPLVTPTSVKNYIQKLHASGQTAEYWEHESRSHAFLDSGSHAVLGHSFEKDAPPALDVMISFLDKVFDEE